MKWAIALVVVLAIALVVVLLVNQQFAGAGRMPMFARHDFEVWDQKVGHRIMSAETGPGLREIAFQYDASAKVVYSLQGLYDKSGVLRFYDLDSRSVVRFMIPVSRSIDYWTCAVVRRRLFMLGTYGSVTNSFHKGRGNQLFQIALDGNSHRGPTACVDIGKSRIGFKVMPLSDSDVCVVGLDVTAKSFFIATYDAKPLRLKNLKMLPKEWTGRQNCDLCATETELKNVALYMDVPMSVEVSPARDKMFVVHKQKHELLILNRTLETEDNKICSPVEFGIKDNSECCAKWIDGESIVVYDPKNGNWCEYNVSSRRVVGKGCVELEAKEPDWREYMRDVLGHRKFYVIGRNGYSRVCTLENGQVKNRAIPRLTYLEYFPPDVVIIKK